MLRLDFEEIVDVGNPEGVVAVAVKGAVLDASEFSYARQDLRARAREEEGA